MKLFKIVTLMALLFSNNALFGMKAGDVVDKTDTKSAAEAAAVASGVETKTRASHGYMSRGILQQVLEMAGVSSPWQLADAFQKGGGIRHRVLFTAKEYTTILRMALLPGGRVAVVNAKTISVIDTATQKIIAELPDACENIHLIQALSSDKIIFYDGTQIKIWNFTTHKVELVYYNPNLDIQSIATLPDGTLLLQEVQQLGILNPQRGVVQKFRSEEEHIRKIIILKDGSILIQCTKSIFRWNPKNDIKELLYKADYEIAQLVEVADNKIAFILYSGSKIYVQNLKDKSVREYKIEGIPPYLLAPLSDGSLVFANARVMGKLNLVTGQVVEIKEGIGAKSSFQVLLPISNSVVAANVKGDIKLWDFDAKKLIAKLESKDDVRSIALLPDGGILAYKDEDISVWEIDEKHLELLYKSLAAEAFTQPVKQEKPKEEAAERSCA